jgi:DNA-directed RNA polymerase subunit RPC12/RpoP
MTTVACKSCGFPIAVDAKMGEGDSITCPSCGTSGILTKISNPVSVPDPLFFGMLGFGIGLIFGPALIKMGKKLGK